MTAPISRSLNKVPTSRSETKFSVPSGKGALIAKNGWPFGATPRKNLSATDAANSGDLITVLFGSR